MIRLIFTKIVGREVKKKIILISTVFSPFEANGTSARARRVMDALSLHFDVHLVTRATPNGRKEHPGDNQIHQLEMKREWYWPIKILKYTLTHRFDVVVCESDWLGFTTYFALSKVRGFRIVFEAHGIISQEVDVSGHGRMNSKFYRLLERFCISKSDFAIALSEDIMREYSKYAKKIETIPVFVDVSNPRLIQPKKNLLYSGTKHIGLIGPFDGSGARNMCTLEFVNSNLSKFDDSIKFVVLGRCDRSLMKPQIEYSGYIQSRQEFLRRVANLDAILVVERMPTAGPLTKILEPMSCGVPVFTTPQGLIGLNHVEEADCLFVTEEAQMVDFLNKTIRDQDSMDVMRLKALDCLRSNYSTEMNAAKIIKIINELVPRSSQTRREYSPSHDCQNPRRG